jgi:Protein of unknown function (DUF2452)
MNQAYNFIAAWQMIPEKCNYESGTPPRSGIFKLENNNVANNLTVSFSWVNFDNISYKTGYNIIADGAHHPFNHPEVADTIVATATGSHTLQIATYKNKQQQWAMLLEIQNNGYLKITHYGFDEQGNAFTNIQFYHKQMSVLPYGAAAAGVVIKATKEGVIKHQALLAMEEQTNMQLNQIREQVDLLAKQAQKIQERKELSMLVYDAKISFKPVIGQVYHLYEKHDGTNLLSLVSPNEWGGKGPFKSFVATVKLLADHTWVAHQ